MFGWKKLEFESGEFPEKQMPLFGPECWNDEPTDAEEDKRLARAFWKTLGITGLVFFVIIPILAAVLRKPDEPKFKPQPTLEMQLNRLQAMAGK